MWVELMEVKNAYIAEAWKELFNAEGLAVRVVPLSEKWAEAGELEPRKLYVPQGKLHVAKEIMRKI
ncbi:MAG: hypothetical protein AMJ77_05020 [Dehalococcoidia bacterium SM23_28_2]|nr:MAG: hypothetical protein AMJ77_05020 [Dehalococcoidia bacterium SM23_28_2]